jgi:hypothetical protein
LHFERLSTKSISCLCHACSTPNASVCMRVTDGAGRG